MYLHFLSYNVSLIGSCVASPLLGYGLWQLYVPCSSMHIIVQLNLFSKKIISIIIIQVILSRKEEVLALEREGEEALGMIHAVLSAVPL